MMMAHGSSSILLSRTIPPASTTIGVAAGIALDWTEVSEREGRTPPGTALTTGFPAA